MKTEFVLIADRTNGEVLYFVESTNGDFMGPLAYSCAARFRSVAAARKPIAELAMRYRGLSNWRAMGVSE